MRSFEDWLGKATEEVSKLNVNEERKKRLFGELEAIKNLMEENDISRSAGGL